MNEDSFPSQLQVNDKTFLMLFDDMAYISEYYQFILKNHAQFCIWLPFLSPTPPSFEEIANIMDTIAKKVNHPNSTDIPYRIIHEGKFVGIVGFIGLHPTKESIEIKYYVDKDVQGKGFTYQCVLPLIAVAKQMKYKKVVIETDFDNEKSKALAKRLGFVFIGDIVEEEDHVISRFEHIFK